MGDATRGSSNDGKGRGRRERDRRGQERSRRREILGCDGRTRRGNSDVLFWQRACWGGRAGWSCNKRGFEQLGLKGLALQGWAPGGRCLGGIGGAPVLWRISGRAARRPLGGPLQRLDGYRVAAVDWPGEALRPISGPDEGKRSGCAGGWEMRELSNYYHRGGTLFARECPGGIHPSGSAHSRQCANGR
ncbi:hypothetical protein BGZ61DRAFT_80865 [Ilyonectria robusta]|uniref:uncharacterized protein n=1 Tax=Ilyonectria robusta TaxID=1079257 RepID=UPI001E8CBB96|nr:uncharacterized protein BGZ61DRAFT_80865 [Ilyonectria robusta]KAH8735531.1 hypothetical protein BGZ61DRAFT_80865 [Ilyonectria robusta]